MKYIYNPVTGTLDDVETPNLGEKYFASAETDALKDMMNEELGPGTIKYGSEIPQPEIKTPQAIYEFGQRNPAANGGMMRQNYENGAEVMTLNPLFPTKDMDSDDFRPIDVGGAVIPPLTISAGAKRLYDILFSKNEDESKEEIVNRLEKIEEDKKDPDQEPPEEDPKGKLIKKTMFEAIKEYEQGKKISDAVKKIKKSDLKKDFKKEAWKEKPIVSGSYAKGTRSVSVAGENIGFFEDLNSFANQEHGGNLKNAVKDITGLDKKSKEFNNVYAKIQNAAKTRDFKFDLQGLKLPQDLLIEGEKNNFSDLTTILKTNPEILKNKLKPLIEKGTLNRNKVYNRAELAEIFGIDITSGTKKENIRQASNFMEVLAKNGAKYKELPGGKKGFALYEAENALLDYSRIKQIRDGENKSDVAAVRKLDDPGFEEFRENFYNYMKKNLNNLTLSSGEKLVLPDSTAQVGHNPIPIAYKKTLKMFKDKKLADKVFNLGNITFQDSEINRETLMRTSGKLLSNLKIIDRHYGKNVSKNNIDELTKAKKGIEEYFKEANVLAKEKSKEFGFVDKDVIGGFTFNVPKIGEKITEKNIKIDMSNVGKQYIVGYVDQINKKAVKFNDLNDKQKKKYAQNFLDQKITQIKSFYKSAKYDPEMIEEIVDALLVGTMPSDTDFTEGVLEKELFKIKKADGGVIPDQEIMNYATGGRVNFDEGSPKPQLDGNDFLNELEFKFNNIDNVTLDDTPITFDDSKSSIAQVADLANPKNIPYYADMAVRAGLRVGEFGTRILPATGQLISDILQKPMFKVKSSYAREDDNEILDYGETPENNNVKFVGGPIFKNFLKSITPTSTEKLVGLDTIINEEKKKMIERGSSSLPVKVAETAALGGELIAPIFPGLKLLRAYAKSKSLPVNDDTKQLLEQDVDMVLESNGMDRRQFLQITGTGGAVILAKMLGFGDELATATKVAEKATAEAVSTYPPPYFFKLVEKINSMGDDVTKGAATQEREIVKSYKNYMMTEDLATGNIVIRKRNEGVFYDQDGIVSDEYIVYKPGQADETTKTTPLDEYDEYTVRPDGDGKLIDSEDGLDNLEEILEEVGDPDSLTLKR